MRKVITGAVLFTLLSVFTGAKAALVTVTPANLDSFISGSFKATLTASGVSQSATGSASLQVKADFAAIFSSGTSSVTLDTAALQVSATVSNTAKLPAADTAHLIAVNCTANVNGMESQVIADLYADQTTAASTVVITEIVEDVAKDPEMKDNLGQFIKNFKAGYKGKRGRDFAKAMKAEKDKYKAAHKMGVGNGKGAGAATAGKGNGNGRK